MLTITAINSISGTVFIMDCNLDNVSVNMNKNLIHKPLANINDFLLNSCCHKYKRPCRTKHVSF